MEKITNAASYFNTLNREKALAEVKLYQSNDWELAEETPEYFLLKRNCIVTGKQIGRASCRERVLRLV